MVVLLVGIRESSLPRVRGREPAAPVIKAAVLQHHDDDVPDPRRGAWRQGLLVCGRGERGRRSGEKEKGGHRGLAGRVTSEPPRGVSRV